ncbi:MAG TPA: hypothetical protein VNS19_13935 [Acidimicrobiales bacterium]|nr:hypothetical protein [Acidimicrobiales bacterium]
MTRSTVLTDDDLAQRIRAACSARVAGVDPAGGPFDPAAPTAASDIDPELGGIRTAPSVAPQRGGRRLLVAAVVLLLVAGAVGAGLARRDPDRTVRTGSTTTTTTVSPVPGPEDAGIRLMAPSTPPFGLVLGGATVRDGAMARTGRTQLYERADDPEAKVLVQVGSGRPTTAPGEAVSVRGTTGQLVHEPGLGRYAGEHTTTLEWMEGAGQVWATAVGMSDEQLLAAVEGLDRRSDVLLDGFAVGAGSPVRPLGEVGPWEGSAPTAELTYGSPLPAGSRPGEDRVVTIDSTAVESGEVSERYLQTWLYGAAAPDLGERAVRWYDPTTSTLAIGAPGEADLQITGTGSNGVSEAQLDEIAATVRPVDRDVLTGLEREYAARLAGQDPGAAWTSTAGPVVELRGTFADPVACIAVGGERRCARSSSPGDPGAVVSVEVDGHWYVGVIGPRSLRATEGLASEGPGILVESTRLDPPFDASIASLVAVPDGIDRMTLWDDDGVPFRTARPPS